MSYTDEHRWVLHPAAGLSLGIPPSGADLYGGSVRTEGTQIPVHLLFSCGP